MTIDDPDLAHLREVLDASFGDGPPLAAPADRLAAGRRALRRRRRAGAAGSAAAVLAVLAASFTVLGDGRSGAQGADPMAPAPTTANSSATPSPSPSLQTLEELRQELAAAQGDKERTSKAQLVSDQFPASLDVDGSLVVKEGWQVTERVAEPLGYRAPEASLGVVVTDGERTRWMLLMLSRMEDEHGNPIGDEVAPSASADDAGKGYSRFQDWLASMVDLQGGPEEQGLVSVDDGDQVRAGPGATLVEVRPAPVIDGYTAAGDRLAKVTREGRVWFVVVRGHGAQAETIPVDAEVLPEPTFDALVTYLTAQAESGQGVR